MVSACSEIGVTVQAVDSMTLEEIFVANVQSRRTQPTPEIERHEVTA
jgi:hypothetical protein